MCVNDHNGYGQHTGKLRAAQFETDDGELYLACINRQITCRKLDNNHIRVGRRTFPVLGYRCYVGNMMWDGAMVTLEVANQIADVLRKDGNYAPESGMVGYWKAWDKGTALFADQQAQETHDDG
jgi:hypothetical protein